MFFAIFISTNPFSFVKFLNEAPNKNKMHPCKIKSFLNKHGCNLYCTFFFNPLFVLGFIEYFVSIVFLFIPEQRTYELMGLIVYEYNAPARTSVELPIYATVMEA